MLIVPTKKQEHALNNMVYATQSTFIQQLEGSPRTPLIVDTCLITSIPPELARSALTVPSH